MSSVKIFLIKNRHTLLRFALPALALFVLYGFKLKQQLDFLEELSFKLGEKKTALSRDEAALDAGRVRKADLEAARSAFRIYQPLLHQEGAGERLVQSLLDLARQYGTQVTGMEAGKAVSGRNFKEITLKVNLEGGFLEQVRFFHALESKTPPFNINTLSMRTDSKNMLKTDFTITALVGYEKIK